jgi:hypothetical protein
MLKMEIKQLSRSVKYTSDYRIKCMACNSENTNVTEVEWCNEKTGIILVYKCSCGHEGRRVLRLYSQYNKND